MTFPCWVRKVSYHLIEKQGMVQKQKAASLPTSLLGQLFSRNQLLVSLMYVLWLITRVYLSLCFLSGVFSDPSTPSSDFTVCR